MCVPVVSHKDSPNPDIQFIKNHRLHVHLSIVIKCRNQAIPGLVEEMSEPAPSAQPKTPKEKHRKTLETSPRNNSRIQSKTQETEVAGRQRQEDNRGIVGKINDKKQIEQGGSPRDPNL